MKQKLIYVVHLAIVFISWTGPFLVSWKLMVPAYIIAVLQFTVFNRCLLNAAHDLEEVDDHTFYSQLFESFGFYPNRRKLKRFVRRYLYLLLALVALIWQLGFGNEAILWTL